MYTFKNNANILLLIKQVKSACRNIKNKIDYRSIVKLKDVHVYHFEMPRHLRQCHVNPQKNREGEKHVAAACLFSRVWSSSVSSPERSHPVKWNLAVLMKGKLNFPECLAWWTRWRTGWVFGKHFTFHHENLRNCHHQLSLKIREIRKHQVRSNWISCLGLTITSRGGKMSSTSTSKSGWLFTSGCCAIAYLSSYFPTMSKQLLTSQSGLNKAYSCTAVQWKFCSISVPLWRFSKQQNKHKTVYNKSLSTYSKKYIIMQKSLWSYATTLDCSERKRNIM